MYHIFINEIKRKLKNPILWILILMMIVLLYISIGKSFETSRLDYILRPQYNRFQLVNFNEELYISDSYKQMYFKKNYEDFNNHFPGENSPSFYKVRLDNYEMFKEAHYNNDIKEKNRTSSFEVLLDTNHRANFAENKKNHFIQYLCEVVNNELWDNVSNGVKYEDVDFSNDRYRDTLPRSVTNEIYFSIRQTFDTRYYYYLYNNNLASIQSVENIEFNNLYVINNLIKGIIPIFIILIPILLNYDLINKDVKEGSTKLLISQSIPRWKYYLSKFFASTIIVVFAVILPLIVTNTYLKTKVKSQPMNYPIVYDQQGLRKFKPSFNYMEENFEIYEKYENLAFYKIPYSKRDPSVVAMNVDYPLYQRNTDLIGFNKFLILTSIYTLLFIMFIVAFIQLCSVIFNNIVVSLLAITGIYGLFYFIFKPKLYGKNYNLSPFTMNNSARIVAGTHNVTMLTAFLVLVSSTFLLLFIGIKYFKKKEI